MAFGVHAKTVFECTTGKNFQSQIGSQLSEKLPDDNSFNEKMEILWVTHKKSEILKNAQFEKNEAPLKCLKQCFPTTKAIDQGRSVEYRVKSEPYLNSCFLFLQKCIALGKKYKRNIAEQIQVYKHIFGISCTQYLLFGYHC